MRRIAVVISTLLFLSACAAPRPPSCEGEKRPINKQQSAIPTKAAIAAEKGEPK